MSTTAHPENAARSGVLVPSGLVAIHKPSEWSSSDVVMKVRGILVHEARQRLQMNKRPKLKVGHGGTLDPMAEGVLVLGIGEGTKLLDQYLAGTKGYTAEALLGAETDTLDSTGESILSAMEFPLR